MNDLPVLAHTKKCEVPEEFKDFLMYDSGTEDQEIILIFGQQTLLELLETTQHLWFADGTFKLSPNFFFNFSPSTHRLADTTRHAYTLC